MELPWIRSRKQGQLHLSVGDIAFSCLIAFGLPLLVGLLVGSPIRELTLNLTVFAALTLPVCILFGLGFLKLGIAGLVPALAFGWLAPVFWLAILALQEFGWRSVLDWSFFMDGIILSTCRVYYAGALWGVTYWFAPHAFCESASTQDA